MDLFPSGWVGGVGEEGIISQIFVQAFCTCLFILLDTPSMSNEQFRRPLYCRKKILTGFRRKKGGMFVVLE
jgi:hypothetical protein